MLPALPEALPFCLGDFSSLAALRGTLLLTSSPITLKTSTWALKTLVFWELAFVKLKPISDCGSWCELSTITNI